MREKVLQYNDIILSVNILPAVLVCFLNQQDHLADLSQYNICSRFSNSFDKQGEKKKKRERESHVTREVS